MLPWVMLLSLERASGIQKRLTGRVIWGDVGKLRYLLGLALLESRGQRQIQACEVLDAEEQTLALHYTNTTIRYAS